jgi:NADH-quinone oxidoreductase subunit N
MMLMTSSTELLLVFIGLEIMSISSYILVGMMRRMATANEAALKYLLLGAFSTGFLLYGISLIYGATGSTQLPTIIFQLQLPGALDNPLAGFGLALLIIGVGFKVALVPFHMWTPDVYSGAPTPVTAFMSAAVKAAGFALLIRIFLTGIPHVERWDNLMWLIAILTMTVGNLMALRQNSVKRMLAYSSIAHAGYVMVAVVVGSEAAISSIIFYSMAYALMGIGAFGVLAVRSKGRTLDTYDDLAGYAYAGPMERVLAVLMSTFMLSLLGLPLTAGFMGKFQIFYAALDAGWVWLTVIAALNSVISLFYYLRVIVHMYMKPVSTAPEASQPAPSVSSLLALTGLVGTAVGIIYLGIFPNDFLQLTQLSVTGISY